MVGFEYFVGLVLKVLNYYYAYVITKFSKVPVTINTGVLLKSSLKQSSWNELKIHGIVLDIFRTKDSRNKIYLKFI